MRRKKGQLVPFEQRILDVLGDREMHGIALAKDLGLVRGRSNYARLYKALRRLETHADLGRQIVSRWESSMVEGRPRRRLYQRRAQGGGGRE
jgi:DNA-binding PadR family transcriptional regulator